MAVDVDFQVIWWPENNPPSIFADLQEAVKDSPILDEGDKMILGEAITNMLRIGDINLETTVSVRTLSHLFDRLYFDNNRDPRTGAEPKNSELIIEAALKSQLGNPVESALRRLERLKNEIDPTYRR